MPLVFSPSNLAVYRQCPRKFYGQSISGAIKYKPTAQKSRGIQMHEAVEKIFTYGWNDNSASMLDRTIDAGYVRQVHDMIWDKDAEGYIYASEYELCINQQGQSRGWWSKDGFMRAKCDVIMVPGRTAPQDRMAIIGDIKTGRKWDDDSFQLRMESLLAHIVFQKPVIRYEYWYVDEGFTVDGEIDFSKGLADVEDIYGLMKDARQAIKNNYFPPVENRFCKWCEWHKRKECGL